jgi:glycerol-3-phosphate dehydrogenase
MAMLAGMGLAIPMPPPRTVKVRLTPLGERDDRPFRHGGRIVCHCEHVTEREITDACSGSIPAVDLDGVRRRTRALAGRCQGFFCSAEVCALAAHTTGRTMDDWMALS